MTADGRMNNLLLGSTANWNVNPSQRGVCGSLGLKRRKALWPLSYNRKQFRLSAQLFTRPKCNQNCFFIYWTSLQQLGNSTKFPRESRALPKMEKIFWWHTSECIAIHSPLKISSDNTYLGTKPNLGTNSGTKRIWAQNTYPGTKCLGTRGFVMTSWKF